MYLLLTSGLNKWFFFINYFMSLVRMAIGLDKNEKLLIDYFDRAITLTLKCYNEINLFTAKIRQKHVRTCMQENKSTLTSHGK